MALKKLCKCGKLIDYADKYCDECRAKSKDRHKDYDKRVRHSKDNIEYNKFYHSREWNKIRQVVIVRDHGLCKDCLKKNKITTYDTVHHIEPIKTNWSKRLDIDNLICLCESCHQIRHKSIGVGGT